MNIDLSPEAEEFGDTARRALEAAGGDDLLPRAELDPFLRHDLVVPVLGELGAWDLDPRASAAELEAAAALCRAAGWWAVPYPVAERLGRPKDDTFERQEPEGMVVVSGTTPAAALIGLDGPWVAITLDGRRHRVTPRASRTPVRRNAFVCELELASTGATHPADVALGLTLPCWTLLGMLDRALALTRAHVMEREQFGQPLAQFQSVQFQLTDAEVERAGVAELARYALWQVQLGGGDAIVDALALRLAAVEAADVAFRICHQLHGAIGFCDETTLSWISRYSQPLRRLPLGLAGTREALTRTAGRAGLAGLFDAPNP